MKKLIIFSLSLLSVFILVGCSSGSTASQCDEIIYGNIFVGENSDKTVEAVVVKDGIIEYAGDKEGAKDYEAGAAEITELGDEDFAIPGVIDGHSHPAVAWDQKSNSLMLKADWNMDKYIEEITKYVKDNPDATVYRVKGFIESHFETAEQKNDPKAILEASSSDVPIVVTDAGGHCVWCNSKAIDVVCEKNPGIKKVDSDNAGHDNASVTGGTIERNSAGEATGFFRDKCTAVVNNACVVLTKDTYRAAILKAQEEYASLGYTAYNESMINESSDVTQTPKLEAYNELEEEGLLTSYVAGSFIVGNREDSDELVDMAIKFRDETKGGNFEVTDIKIFMDGVVEGGSSYLEEPYEHNVDGSDAGDYRGTSSWANDLDKLTEIIAKANNAGMACHFHATGDQASLDLVNCIEAAAEEIGADKVREARNVVTHLQIVDDSIYSKFAEYDITANLNPWAYKGPGFYEETEVLCLGEERASKEYPYRSFLDNGVNCAFGTDYGSSNIYHFNESFLALTARKYATVDEPEINDDTLLNEKEKFSRVEAINVFTAGGAYQMKKENEMGTIEAGKRANITVVNKNLLTVDEKDIMDIEIQKTMFDGNWVYSAE